MNDQQHPDAADPHRAADDQALRRVWARVEQRTAPRRHRRRRAIVAGGIALVALFGASSGVAAYADHMSGAPTPPPLRSTTAVFGDPDYASGSKEERALGRINAMATRAGAIGSYRPDATRIVVRVPASASVAGTTRTVSGFSVSFVASRFTRASLSSTRHLAKTVALSDPTTLVSFALDYYAETDTVGIDGVLPDSVFDRLNAIPGVVATRSSGPEFQADSLGDQKYGWAFPSRP